MLNVKLKRLDENAKLPTRKTDGAAGYDVYLSEGKVVASHSTVILKTGIAVEIPEGYSIAVRGRSGLSSKGLLVSLGTIDSDYRGEIGVILTNTNPYTVELAQGDRIGQIKLEKDISMVFEEVDNLSDTTRGTGGFGSTGR